MLLKMIKNTRKKKTDGDRLYWRYCLIGVITYP